MLSEEFWSLQSIPSGTDLCDACHTFFYKPKPWLISLVLVTFIVPLKADPQAPACFSEYHDNDYSLMPIKDVRSDDYAPGTTSSEECARPTKVGSRNGRSFPLLIMTNDNGNIIAMLHEALTTCFNIHRDLL
jgi:hypothetical protein